MANSICLKSNKYQANEEKQKIKFDGSNRRWPRGFRNCGVLLPSL
jgi:hypothetical protein